MEPYLRRSRCSGNVWGFNTLVRRCLGVLGWIVFGLNLWWCFIIDILILRDSKGNVFILLMMLRSQSSLFGDLQLSWIDRYFENKDCNIQILKYPITHPVAMENEDSLWSTWNSYKSLWVDGAHMKQVVDGTHASPQVEQYENNLNECLWLSIFSGGWLVGKAHMLHMLIDLEEKCFNHLLYQRLAVWWVGWETLDTLATWLKRMWIVNDWNFAGSPGAFTSVQYDYVLIVLYTNNCIDISRYK